MSDDSTMREGGEGDTPWPQRVLDNLWLLLAIGIVVPALIYLGWGLLELADLPTWGGR